jgi:5-methylcytosine-specific restriction endonuclease McrA
MKDRPLCKICKIRYAEKSYQKNGNRGWRSACYLCRKNGDNRSSRKKRRDKFKTLRNLICQDCGFVAKDVCQLELDHIDGNKNNNNANNQVVLCSNCHKLKTKLNNDYRKKYK